MENYISRLPIVLLLVALGSWPSVARHGALDPLLDALRSHEPPSWQVQDTAVGAEVAAGGEATANCPPPSPGPMVVWGVPRCPQACMDALRDSRGDHLVLLLAAVGPVWGGAAHCCLHHPGWGSANIPPGRRQHPAVVQPTAELAHIPGHHGEGCLAIAE